MVLFDGKDLSAWHPAPTWKLEDGEIVAGEGKLISKANFGDVQIHLLAGVAFDSVECAHRAGVGVSQDELCVGFGEDRIRHLLPGVPG